MLLFLANAVRLILQLIRPFFGRIPGGLSGAFGRVAVDQPRVLLFNPVGCGFTLLAYRVRFVFLHVRLVFQSLLALVFLFGIAGGKRQRDDSQRNE